MDLSKSVAKHCVTVMSKNLSIHPDCGKSLIEKVVTVLPGLLFTPRFCTNVRGKKQDDTHVLFKSFCLDDWDLLVHCVPYLWLESL